MNNAMNAKHARHLTRILNVKIALSKCEESKSAWGIEYWSGVLEALHNTRLDGVKFL